MKTTNCPLESLLLLCKQLNASSDEEIQNQLRQLYLDSSGTMLQAVRLFLHGSLYLNQQVAYFEPLPSRKQQAPVILPALSRREKEVLLLLASGYTFPQIGEKLFISPATVNNHCSRMREKLGLRGRNALLNFAFANKAVQ